MASSDSEGFESADEGHNSTEKRKHCLSSSSSNYGDPALETATEVLKPINKTVVKEVESTDGWDVSDTEEPGVARPVERSDEVGGGGKKVESKTTASAEASEQGWDDFDDWGGEGTIDTNITNKMADISITNQTSGTEQKTNTSGPSNSASGPNNSPSATSNSSSGVNNSPSGPNNSASGPKNSSSGPNNSSSATNNSGSVWGWGGWGVDSLLSQATAGITSLTNQVSAGITTVLETGIGIPDPEELARRPARPDALGQPGQSDYEQGTGNVQEKSKDKGEQKTSSDEGKSKHNEREGAIEGEGDAFPFGNILKIVGTTSSKMLSGGLDTLETIGRKTMEVLQDGDPGLARKRAMIGLSQQPVLSAVLREAAARADDDEDTVQEHHREPRYETLFDDYGGLLHLEALEMVSRQTALRVEERLQATSPHGRGDMAETMAQIEELCEMPDDEEEPDGDTTDLLERLQKATEDLGVKLQFEPLVSHHAQVLDVLSDGQLTSRQVYSNAISSLARATALAMELYHKVAEMLMVKPRRSTADEADSLTQMTVVLCRHTSEMARLFTDRLNATMTAQQDGVADTSCEQTTSSLVTNVFLEAENSGRYVRSALVLVLPIIQIGAFGRV